jgi:phosphohistidine phosphatase
MQVLIIRHGRAEDRASDGRDASRRLTEDGRARMREVARGLKTQIDAIDCLATSPLPRARETAGIVADVMGATPPEPLDLLAPGVDAKAVLRWLASQPSSATVALVGHEPDLSRLATAFTSGGTSAAVVLKKGAVCLIEFDGEPAMGTGTLVFLMQPAQLRRLG